MDILIGSLAAGLLIGLAFALVALGLDHHFRCDGHHQLRPRRVSDDRHVHRPC
jgi:hypothetical protein